MDSCPHQPAFHDSPPSHKGSGTLKEKEEQIPDHFCQPTLWEHLACTTRSTRDNLWVLLLHLILVNCLLFVSFFGLCLHVFSSALYFGWMGSHPWFWFTRFFFPLPSSSWLLSLSQLLIKYVLGHIWSKYVQNSK